MTQHKTMDNQVSEKRNYGSCEIISNFDQNIKVRELYNFGDRCLKVITKLHLITQSFENDGTKKSGSLSEDSALMQMSWPPSTTTTIKSKSIEFTNYSRNDQFDDNGIMNTSEADTLTLLQRASKAIPCLGIIFSLCASVFLGSAGMLVKMTTSVHGIQVAVFRAVIQLLIYGSMIKFKRSPYLPEAQEFMPVMCRAFLGASSITFSYCALKLIPLGDATTIRFSLPIWTLIISFLVLNESCNFYKWFAVLLSISGVVLIAKPDDCIYVLNGILDGFKFESSKTQQLETIQNTNYTTFNLEEFKQQQQPLATQISNEPHRQLEGSLLALASSICLSISIVALRLCKHTPAEVTILWLSIISIVIGSISLVIIQEWRLPNNWLDVMYIFLNGLCGSIGQWFITNALKIEQSGIISLARTFDIEVAFLYSAFILHENIRISSIVGSVLVSFGVVAVVLPKWFGNGEGAGILEDNNNHHHDDNQQNRASNNYDDNNRSDNNQTIQCDDSNNNNSKFNQ